MKKNNVNEKQKEVEAKLVENSKLEVDKLFEQLKTSYAGISIVDVEDRLEEYGKNEIDIENNNTLLHKIREAVINPFNIVLIIVALITLFTDVIIATEPDYSTFILIMTTVLVSGISVIILSPASFTESDIFFLPISPIIGISIFTTSSIFSSTKL